MSQRYRLRLGDGTTLLVDHDGLSTWETDRMAAVGTKDPHKWIPLREFLVQERAVAFRRAREEGTRESPPGDIPETTRDDGLPLVPPPPREATSGRPDFLPPSTPLVDGDPLREDPPAAEEPHALDAGPWGADDAQDGSLPSQPIVHVPSVPVGLQVLADEPVAPSPVATSLPTEDLPVIPLKPLEDAPPRPLGVNGQAWEGPFVSPGLRVQPVADGPASPAGASSRRAPPREEDLDLGEAIRLDGPAAVAIQITTIFGTFLSRCLDPINRLERGLSPFAFDTGTRRLHRGSPRRGGVSLPTLELDLGEMVSRASTALRRLSTRTGGWLDRLTSRASRLTLRESPPPPALPQGFPNPGRPAFFEEPPTPRRSAPAWHDPGPPFPDATELPVLRLAPVSEPPEVGDVHSSDEDESVASSVRLWTRRVAVTVTLLAGGVIAARHWETWSPGAVELAGTVFNEMDRRVRSLHLARERQAVIDQASEQLPYLARDTIRLVLSSSPAGLLEPPRVFETAWEAAKRGTPMLAASEAEELEGLRQELVDGLRPSDRDRLHEFGRASARGGVFAFDARQGLLAYSRGVRALPQERRERLQALLGKAIAAGLARQADSRL